ncbi:ATP-binding protein [Lyngbya sp. CCY1209]|uniref:ATP-binding protein n=1 Tax=Lyngbya sp. CCY1209 TaxID=2886103 RepID=UPI002D207588|nr:ATP-binding protein [Lyngbya sp. CCY1209]MEB3883439.1 ATP-binding protein [Lyngbya sp. CCY1209]
MELNKILRFADERVFSKTGKHLDDLQEAILKEALQGRKYAKIAQDRDCSEGYVRVVASELWKILADALGEEVSKANVRSILERAIIANNANISPVIGRDHVTVNNNVSCFPEHMRSPVSDLPKPKPQDQPYLDLSDAPEVLKCYGRDEELSILKRWVVSEENDPRNNGNNNCAKIVAILGVSGMGKTTLAISLAEEIKSNFNFIIYRDLSFSPTLETILNQLLKIFSLSSKMNENLDIETKISRILSYLRYYRCLILLDNVQEIFSPGKFAGQYQSVCQDYHLFLKKVSEVYHQSCFILISSEKPREIAELEQLNLPIFTLVLDGLGMAAKDIFISHQLSDQQTWERLINIYQGNPLWLNIIATLIRELFGGKVGNFLQYEMPILDESLCWHLEQQFQRLSAREVVIVTQLSKETEAIPLSDISNRVKLPLSDLINGIKSLVRRFILETKQQGDTTLFSLNSVMAQYVKTRQDL